MIKAHKAHMQPLADAGHDAADLMRALELSQSYGHELHTGVLYRNPAPPATFEALARERREQLAPQALPRERILDLFLQE